MITSRCQNRSLGARCFPCCNDPELSGEQRVWDGWDHGKKWAVTERLGHCLAWYHGPANAPNKPMCQQRQLSWGCPVPGASSWPGLSLLPTCNCFLPPSASHLSCWYRWLPWGKLASGQERALFIYLSPNAKLLKSGHFFPPVPSWGGMSKCQNTWGRGIEAVLVFPAGTSRVLKTDAKAILLKVPSSSFQRVTGPTSWDRRPNFPKPVWTPKPCTSSRAALPAPQRTMKKQKERGGIYIWIYVRCIRSMLLYSPGILLLQHLFIY